jgi:hypothetical protein
MPEAPRPARGVGEQVLDLGVDAPQVVVGPVADRLEQPRVESEQEPFALGHGRPGA